MIFPAIDSNEIIANVSNPRKNHEWWRKDGLIKIFSYKIVLTEFEMLDGHCFDLILDIQVLEVKYGHLRSKLLKEKRLTLNIWLSISG